MTSTKKRIAIFIIVAVYALSLVSGLAYILTNDVLEAFAKTTDTTYSYYYDNLTITGTNGKTTDYSLAKKFYEVLEELNDKGDFKDGKIEYDLTKLLTSEQIAAWVENGNLEIPKAFGAARDSFLMDHPELFYIDVYKIMISAGRTGGKYVAYIDSGKEANVYRSGAFTSEQAVNAAIIAYNNAVKAIADKAITEAKKDTSDEKEDCKLAKAANKLIAESTKYDFGAYDEFLESGVASASVTYTAYGALVAKKAVCSGFAFAYKAVMDYLGIPCVVVSGYSKGLDADGKETDGDVGHSWNYVQLETVEKTVSTNGSQPAALAEEKTYSWFAFDTTWNSLRRDKNTFSVMNYVTASSKHVPDPVISSSNYSLTYPALSGKGYGQAIDPTNMSQEVIIGGFTYRNDYQWTGSAYILVEKVSYEGMNSLELLEKNNLRLVMRNYYAKDGEKKYTAWTDVHNWTEYGQRPGATSSFYLDDDGIQTINGANNGISSQYAIVSGVEPDIAFTLDPTVLYEYSEGKIKEENFVFISQEFQNEAYGTYTPAPYIVSSKSYPIIGTDVTINDRMRENSNSNLMADDKAILVHLVYDEPLRIIDETKDIDVFFSASSYNINDYAGFATFSDGKRLHLIADENGVLNTLEFKFKPSMMYEHNRESYVFTFSNVGSAKIVDKLIDGQMQENVTSDKVPNHAYYVFSRMYRACPCVFGDGRLWIECCAQPTLVDNSDLSAMDFKDEKGNSTFSESERSQMMLVVNDVRSETKNTMLDEISSDSKINVNKDEIEKSQTYDINLQICGKYATIPDGSYVKIGLGFPEGYGPDDEGVTFKLFHRKHIKETDTYVIEEVPCVVTKFGIVATVTSFSPYMVAVVPESKASTDKTVYASIDGKGGKLTNEDGQIQTVKQGGSYTYTITPDEGYQLYKVTLNGKDVTANVKDGKLKLTYDELASNNELEIQYIANEAAVRYAEKKIVDPVKVVVSVEDKASFFKFDQTIVFDTDKLSAGAIVGIVLGSAAIAAVVALAVVAVVKDKKQAQK